jgi:acetyl-CoA carboxylase carboxyl transferase subunit alpha
LIALRVVDRVIEEPVGGAHADPALAVSRVGDTIESELKALLPLSGDALRDQRAQRFYAIGRS